MAAAYDLANTWAEEARLRTEQPTRGCDDDAATPTSCAPVRTDHVAVLVVEGRAESQVVLVDEEPGRQRLLRHPSRVPSPRLI
jgi:hypothetical protein